MKDLYEVSSIQFCTVSTSLNLLELAASATSCKPPKIKFGLRIWRHGSYNDTPLVIRPDFQSKSRQNECPQEARSFFVEIWTEIISENMGGTCRSKSRQKEVL